MVSSLNLAWNDVYDANSVDVSRQLTLRSSVIDTPVQNATTDKCRVLNMIPSLISPVLPQTAPPPTSSVNSLCTNMFFFVLKVQFCKAMELTGSELKDKINYFGTVWWPERTIVQKAFEMRYEVICFTYSYTL